MKFYLFIFKTLCHFLFVPNRPDIQKIRTELAVRGPKLIRVWKFLSTELRVRGPKSIKIGISFWGPKSQGKTRSEQKRNLGKNSIWPKTRSEQKPDLGKKLIWADLDNNSSWAKSHPGQKPILGKNPTWAKGRSGSSTRFFISHMFC